MEAAASKSALRPHHRTAKLVFPACFTGQKVLEGLLLVKSRAKDLNPGSSELKDSVCVFVLILNYFISCHFQVTLSHMNFFQILSIIYAIFVKLLYLI